MTCSTAWGCPDERPGPRPRPPAGPAPQLDPEGPGGQVLYLTCGEYPDGSLGEIFLDLGGASTPMRGMLSGLARVVSINLQYGVPLEAIVHSLRGQDFLPQGEVEGSPEVKQARSLIDYVCKQLEAVYLRPAELPAPEKVAGAHATGSGI